VVKGDASGASKAEAAHAGALRPIGVAIATTALVTALSYAVPDAHAASAVGLAFLAVTYLLTLRSNDAGAAGKYGLALGGLFEPEPIDWRRLATVATKELGFVLALCVVVFPPFWVGWVAWWSPRASFHAPPLSTLADDALGQFLVIALPEEAFYRGYLQTSLDDAWPPRWSLMGTRLGPALVVTSAVFALGHVATELHASRLAVFFPSLLFGFLRSRRGSVGASAAFHALCNLFAAYLARGYGFGG
jgi:membrane protease YdiL (CAAX protease family)